MSPRAWRPRPGPAPSRFFFFQAEDGIRDDLVTGVQTCALPIYLCSKRGGLATVARIERSEIQEQSVRLKKAITRSEERRVGKEGRARGSRDRDKKKEAREEERGIAAM